MICIECKQEFDLKVLRKRNRSARGKFCGGVCAQNNKVRLARAKLAPYYEGMKPKHCAKCKDTKPATEFRFYNSKRTYLCAYCRVCQDEYQANRWKKVKAKAVAFLGGKCVCCNIVDDPCIYDFHHIKEKEMDWTNLMRQSWDNIVKELSKCELICSNCHRKHTAYGIRSN